MSKTKYLAVPAAAVAATAGAGQADATALITQDFGYTAAYESYNVFDVNIGNNATTQYRFGDDKASFLESNDGFSQVAPSPGSQAVGTPNETFKDGVGSLSDGYYHLRFDLDGLTRYGYATVSNGGTTLDSVTYAVPEPSSWALMILGFGATGAAMRRRRQPSALVNA